MATSHLIFQFVAGDDWEIDATLLDDTGAPYDLNGATIKWTMVDGNGQRVIQDSDVSISITNAAAGECKIMVAATKTTTIAGGRYADAVRIIKGGVSSTLSLGPIQVTADPWAVQAVALQAPTLRVVA